MPLIQKLASAPAVMAALSLTVTPAAAADMALPAPAPAYAESAPVLDVEANQTAEHGRHYHRHRYRYHRRSGLGDVLTGVLIIGAVAQVAKHATRDDRRYRDRDYRRDVRWDDNRGIDRAVEMCVDAVERRERVETVDRADRTARGWTIEGSVARGGGFSCEIDSDGRGVEVDIRRGNARYERDDDDRYDDDRYDEDRYADIDYDDDRDFRERDNEDDQWDDDRYSSEWSKVDSAGAAQTARSQTPAYPGGPVEDDAEIDGDLEIGTGYPGAGA